MTRVRTGARRGRGSTWWWTLSLAFVVAGVLVLVLAPRGPSVGPSITTPIGSTSLTPAQLRSGETSTTTRAPSSAGVGTFTGTLASMSVASARATTPVAARRAQAAFSTARPVGRSRPVHLTIPTLGISVSLSELGLNPDNTVQVPTDFAQPGWYKYGPAPGQRGSAVILGHVDSYRGLAVFFYLDRLRPGNQVIVTTANGRTLTFSVIGLRMYPKSSFPDRLVYGPRPYAALQLVTCGGVFDHQEGSYLSNIVVYTALVKTQGPPRRAATRL